MALVGAAGLGGCVTSATTGGVMAVLKRAPDAPAYDVTFGLLAATVDSDRYGTASGGPRILDYSYDPDFSSLAAQPALPTSLAVLKRPEKALTRLYHA